MSTADAVDETLQGMSPSGLVRSVAITPRGSTADVQLTLARNDDAPVDVWSADVALGAIIQRISSGQELINQVVSTATAIGPDAKGDLVTSPLSLGYLALNQSYDSPSDAQLTSRVNEVAAKLGISVSSLTITHPLQSAVDVTFVVPDSVSFSVDQLRTALVGTSPDVEGILIRLVAPDGSPLVTSGVAYRTGEGGLTFASGQDTRFGANHG